MPCYSPLKAYQYGLTENGKKRLVFKRYQGAGEPIQVPCGQCIGCRLEQSRQWAMRIMHEADLYEDNCFLTLTYNDANVPDDYNLDKRHYQLFMKRLRKKYGGKKIRFFHCGEYGEEGLRPHYHACIFNHDFDDKEYYTTVNGNKLWTSTTLESLWTHGFCTIGELTFDSAAYVARYVTKKVTGKRVEEDKRVFGLSPYNRCNISTGELYDVSPEYATMSRRPGIGKEWYEMYKKDVYPSDYLVINGKKCKPPKYYDSLYSDIESIKEKRLTKAVAQKENNTPERLRIRRTIKMAQITSLKRKLS